MRLVVGDLKDCGAKSMRDVHIVSMATSKQQQPAGPRPSRLVEK